ncbi:putative inactive group IIC secretory phospholipase A2 isoform X1 [Dipodomys merriami]|uniref:putative inactive group IIC secretory phospholipase A2 isoform X1 n=1 Tax=Dipodomys merriami TaxID=94247 RepID=UPI003855E3E0
MKVITILIVFVSCWPAPSLGSFWQFQRMVKHITGRSAFFSYYGYGCYCGLGGKGIPVDDTDRCCRAHDCCYQKLKALGCQPVLNTYQFYIANGTVAYAPWVLEPAASAGCRPVSATSNPCTASKRACPPTRGTSSSSTPATPSAESASGSASATPCP